MEGFRLDPFPLASSTQEAKDIVSPLSGNRKNVPSVSAYQDSKLRVPTEQVERFHQTPSQHLQRTPMVPNMFQIRLTRRIQISIQPEDLN